MAVERVIKSLSDIVRNVYKLINDFRGMLLKLKYHVLEHSLLNLIVLLYNF